jgi:hypothetical protein
MQRYCLSYLLECQVIICLALPKPRRECAHCKIIPQLSNSEKGFLPNTYRNSHSSLITILSSVLPSLSELLILARIFRCEFYRLMYSDEV